MTDDAIRKGFWGIRGKVVHGHGRGGSQLGFPTANVRLDDDVIQRLGVFENGVYFGWGQVEASAGASAAAGTDTGSVIPFVMSVGFNPHFRDKALTVEIHFVHKFAVDFYDATVRALVVGHIRDQGAFESIEKLIAIIREDCRVAMDALGTQFAALQKAHFFRESIDASPYLAVPLSGASLVSNM